MNENMRKKCTQGKQRTFEPHVLHGILNKRGEIEMLVYTVQYSFIETMLLAQHKFQ